MMRTEMASRSFFPMLAGLNIQTGRMRSIKPAVRMSHFSKAA
jgi:hypothetical protein